MGLLSHRIETGLSLLLEQLNNRKACNERMRQRVLDWLDEEGIEPI
jgi:hypothetical protein